MHLAPTAAITRFVDTHADSTVTRSSQTISFDARNGRTITIVLNDRGGFAGGMAHRGENLVGHASTLRSLTALAAAS